MSDNGEGFITKEHYLYDKERDVYIVKRLGQDTPLTMSGTRLRALRRAYINNADTSRICADFDLDRASFQLLRKAFQLTRSSSTYTIEELHLYSEEELVAESLRAKEQRVQEAIQRAQWNTIKQKASKWDDYQKVILDELKRFSWARLPQRKAPRPTTTADHAVVLGITDVHIGKRPHGKSVAIQDYVDRVLDTVGSLIKRSVQWWGVPTQWYLMIGSDLLHVDSLKYTTTAGTPQGGQTVGSVYQHVRASIDFMARVIDEASRLAPVDSFWIPGNHDRLLSYTVACALQQRYALQDHIKVDVGEAERKIRLYRHVPMMFLHGDNVKQQQLPSLLANGAADVVRGTDATFNLRSGAVFQGHLHRNRRMEDEVDGIDIITLSTTSPNDDWHHQMGFDQSKKRVSAFRIDPNSGISGVCWEHF